MSIVPPGPAPSKGVASRASVAMFTAAHLAALPALFLPLTPALAGLGLGSYLLRMWGITAGYHRYFSHRSFRTGRAFQFALAWVGATAVQNGPLWWASWHRLHHKHSDEPKDPHSPVQGGFWHAQAGWYYDGAHIHADLSNVKDFSCFPELRFIERNAWLPPLSLGLTCLAIGGLGGVVWGFVVPTLLVLHGVGLVNSAGHRWGSRRYATPDGSRNNALIAFMTLGEGWHNNHHHYMISARHGFRWWEFDATYLSLRVLERVGLVRDLRVPSQAVLDAEGNPAHAPVS